MGAGTAFAGAAALLGNLATSYQNVQAVQQTNAENRGMVALQNQANEELWRKQVDYNNPINQVQRLRAAGLNPSIMYGQGSVANTADAPPTMQASKDVAPQSTFNIDPLTAAQIANINADTKGKELQNEYQDYMNEVERQLAHIPIGEVRSISDDGTEVVSVQYGNARVMMSKTELRQLRLSENQLQWQLNDLFYDLALKFGDYSFNGSVADQDPMNTPNFVRASAALRGDYQVRELAGKIADISEKAAKAEQAGREAYSNWLNEHKDDPFVKFALTLQGFFQSIGFTPSVSYGKNDGMKWMFGK